METLSAPCRVCKATTKQIERIVTDNLPPNVKTLQCIVCGTMGVVLLESSE